MFGSFLVVWSGQLWGRGSLWLLWRRLLRWAELGTSAQSPGGVTGLERGMQWSWICRTAQKGSGPLFAARKDKDLLYLNKGGWGN